jgi:predicted Zn-dependent protease with MMP-like domain
MRINSNFTPQFTDEEFEQMVIEALEALPVFFKERLQNVDVIVADWPTEAEQQSVNLKPGHMLFGLYQGIPLTRRTGSYNMVLPDKITVYRLPIEMAYRTPKRIKEQVQHVVKHELAHHFGISDDRLRELGAY